MEEVHALDLTPVDDAWGIRVSSANAVPSEHRGSLYRGRAAPRWPMINECSASHRPTPPYL
jgi:hypothetical protein